VLSSANSFRIGFGPVAVPEVGARPLFLLPKRRFAVSTIQTDIEARLAASEPDVEVLLAEVLGGHTLRLFIDHPDGVTLGLCERVTKQLGDLRERYALEVSSPGTERPLSKPQHFQRFLGRKARVRTRGDVRDDDDEGGGRRHRSFTGELVGASEDEVTIAADGALVAIPYAEIQRSHLIEE
jgi:ribosome maturation factor RimP